MVELKFDLIGLGKMGKYHAETLSKIPDIYFSAVCDTNPKLDVTAKKYGVKFYTDYIQMIKEENPDAVSIVVPVNFHAKIMRDCINLGQKYIFVEKPAVPIRNVSEGYELLRLASENGSMIMVGDIICYDPATQVIKENLNKLGKISSILCLRFGPYPYRMDDVGVNEDLLVHDLTLARYLLGWPKFYFTKSPIQASLYRKHQIDFSTIEAKTQDGITFISSDSWIPEKKVRIAVVVGEKSIAQINFTEEDKSVRLLPPEIIKEIREGSAEDWQRLESERSLLGKDLPVKKEGPLENELKHFINCIKNKGIPLTNLEKSLETLEMLYPTVL